jgi:sugar O-acyltransferase (sialic acid O-acetyltransferase NeuD family)
MTRPVLIFGCGGHGKVVADAARAAGLHVLGFADDDATLRDSFVLGLPVLAIGPDETKDLCAEKSADLVLAIGDNRTRAMVFDRALASGLHMATIIHPSAVVAPTASVGAGTVVFARAVINPDCRIGDDVIVNTAVSMDHDNVIGKHAHISPGAVLGGTVTVGEGTHVGIGTTVSNNISIGTWSVVGAGSVVVSDIPDRVVAYGVPARTVRPREA